MDFQSGVPDVRSTLEREVPKVACASKPPPSNRESFYLLHHVATKA